MAGQAVILFDGVCNLCNASVDFILKRDSHAYFKFASLQSEVAQKLLSQQGKQPSLDSILLIEENQIFERSTAILRIARRLRGLWPLMAVFLLIPPLIRDAIYQWIARNRYRWFGKKNTCRIPSPEEKSRFL